METTRAKSSNPFLKVPAFDWHFIAEEMEKAFNERPEHLSLLERKRQLTQSPASTSTVASTN